jgi:DNA-binding transcriptional LysR family regulator
MVVEVSFDVNGSFSDRDMHLIDVSERWLRIFDVVAEAGAFTRAARYLGVGQPAVSYAVKSLETAIGTPLFVRLPSGIRLTPAGEELRRHTSAAFTSLRAGIVAAKAHGRPEAQITLSVSTSFATYWLMPRLSRFRQVQPMAQLRCITNDTDAGIGTDGADIWIPLGSGTWPGFDVAALTDEILYPVASPEVARRAAGAAGLTGDDLIHLEERYTERFDWHRWFASFPPGRPVDLDRGSSFSDYSTVVQAAIDGQGVALGWHHIVSGLVEEGRLSRLDDRLVTTDTPFVILTRPKRRDAPLVAAMREWLIAELRGRVARATPR